MFIDNMDELQIQSSNLTLQNNLPQELITNEILVRLPIKSLTRFKSVSKEWKSIVSSPRFAKSHLHFHQSHPHSKQSFLINNSVASYYSFDYSGFDSGEIIPSNSDFDDSDDYTPFGKKGISDIELPSELAAEIYHPEGDGVSFVGSCDGLVCVKAGLDSLYIWNIITKELRKIYKPASFYKKKTIWGFGHDSSVHDYRILGLSKDIDSDKKNAFVLGLRGEKWREVNVLEDFNIDIQNCGVLVNEMMFWKMRNRFSILSIIGFDLADEKFSEVEAPDWVQSVEYYSLSAVGGCLCVCIQNRGVLTMGLLKHEENGDSGYWVKLQYHLNTSVENLQGCNVLSGFTRSGKLVLVMDYMFTYTSFIFLLDPNQNPPALMLILDLSCVCDIVNYVESLVSPFYIA